MSHHLIISASKQKTGSRKRFSSSCCAIRNGASFTRSCSVNKHASPTAGVIDSQSVKTTESDGIRGFDAGKKVKGRKCHTIVDTLGLMVGLMFQSADIQDRDGAPDLGVFMGASRCRR